MALIRSLSLLALVTSCATSTTETPQPPENLVKNHTILPESFGSQGAELFTHLLVPNELLRLSVVSRPRAEVREGPALHFPVQDNILTVGDKVIEFQRVDVWSRIIAVKSGQRGWVHYQTLQRDHRVPQKVEVETQLLPNVFTKVEGARLYDYPSQRALEASIPRGRALRMLMQGRSRAIVWLAETNTVAWIELEDIE